jgi:hypothetical protein
MIEYEENAELKAAVEDMLADKTKHEFNMIREQEVKIYTLLCVRTNSDGDHVQGKGAPIVCKKISAPFQALTGGHYLVIADYYFWNHVDERQRNAKLFHALMHIEVERTEKGEIKIGTRKPELQVFRSELAHYGPYDEPLMDLEKVLKEGAKRFADSLKSRQ